MAYGQADQGAQSYGSPTNDNGYQQSASPEPSGDNPAKAVKHRRNYQACEPCRERKVKCDMGDVDNPHDGPCKKCAREKKECWFKPHRRKNEAEPRGSTGSADTRPAKRARHDSNPPAMAPPNTFSPKTASGYNTSNGMQSPLSADAFQPASPFAFTQQLPGSNLTPSPRSVPSQFPPTSIPYPTSTNNLPTLTQVSKGPPQARANDQDEHWVAPQRALQGQFTNTMEGMNTLISAAEMASGNMQKGRTRTLTGGKAEPDFKNLSPEQVEIRKRAIKVWERMRLVRAGWFTAEEAMQYVEYFYAKLAPMTPVVTQDFRSPAKHHVLLSEEPVLALAILSIASRHLVLQSAAKSTRHFYIHEKLWEALRKIVQRLLWGQEQFGGGFCGAGLAPIRESGTGQINWKGSLRTLGTIEALLLLTDWQPRALHFPPGDDENKLVDSTDDLLEDDDNAIDDEKFANLPYSQWLEPAWRSDRMSWMLLGLAQSLAFELGVFDNEHANCGLQHGPNSECMRKRRLRKLVITYVSQISGRIGIQASLSPAQDYDEKMKDGDSLIDKMQKLWFDIAAIMHDANRTIFASRKLTNDLIQTGNYKKMIANLVPRLQKWEREFDVINPMLDEPMKHILRMEYEYARLYINSLGMQKVVESWVQQAPNHTDTRDVQYLVPIVNDNKYYIDEVRSAATRILREILYGLAARGNLRDAPVRTFLRGISGMMFTLKLFSLGNDAKVIRESIKLLRATTQEMSKHAVDDVHLSPHTAQLVQHLMDDVSRNMIRVQKLGSREQSRQISPQPQTYPQRNASTDGEYITIDNESPDPLAEIPFADFNVHTFMPPPNFDPQAMQDMNVNLESNMDPAMFSMSDDWLAMPLDNLFSTRSSNTINQGFGGIGPTVGERDFLAVLTGNHYDQNNMPGMSTGYNPFGNGI